MRIAEWRYPNAARPPHGWIPHSAFESADQLPDVLRGQTMLEDHLQVLPAFRIEVERLGVVDHAAHAPAFVEHGRPARTGSEIRRDGHHGDDATPFFQRHAHIPGHDAFAESEKMIVRMTEHPDRRADRGVAVQRQRTVTGAVEL